MWRDFFQTVQKKGDLHPNITNIHHPAAPLLSPFQKVGTPTIMSGKPWSNGQIKSTLQQGPHFSSQNGIEFLQNEFADTINKQQWIVLSAETVKKLFGLRLSPISLVPQKNCRNRMIFNYSYFDDNTNTFNIEPAEAIKQTLWQLVH